jgi:hypothetical protein
MNGSDSTIKIQICDTVNPSVVQVYGYTYLHFVYLQKSKGHLDLCLALFLSYHFAIWP